MSCLFSSSLSRLIYPVIILKSCPAALYQITRNTRSRMGIYRPIRAPALESPAANVSRNSVSKTGAALDPFSEDVDPEFLDSIAPELPVSFNLAAYVNRSASLQQLVKLGVDLSIVEKHRSSAELLLNLDFDRDMKDHIQLLSDMGIPAEDLGRFLTANPMIFKVSINNIKARVEYLLSKRFPMTCVTRIISAFPAFLNYSIKDVDARLGYLQSEFSLSPDNLRTVLIQHPRLISIPNMSIRMIKFSIKEVLGFSSIHTSELITQVPAILSRNHQDLVNIFDLLHNTALVSHELMIRFPEVFLTEVSQVRDRLAYLKVLNRQQFDPSLPLYVPLTAVSTASDEVFATKYARTSEQDYDLFLRNR